MSLYVSPGVYINEVDQTELPAGPAITVAAVVIEATKGPANTRVLISTPQEFEATFGRPDPSLGLGYLAQMSALAYLRAGLNLYVTRVVNGAEHGSVVVMQGQDTSGETHLLRGTFGEADPYADNLSVPFTDSTVFTLYDKGPRDDVLAVSMEPNTNTPEGGFYVHIFETVDAGGPIESFLVSLEHRLNGLGEQMFIEDYINLRSSYVTVRVNMNRGTEPVLTDALMQTILSPQADPSTSRTPLAGGTHGQNLSDAPPPVLDQKVIDGYRLYEARESSGTNILINAGWPSTLIKGELNRIASSRRCMAILDIPGERQATSLAVDYRKNVLNMDSNFSAIYAPWLKVSDRYNGTQIWAPPSGYVAANFAYSDANFARWWSPAGMTRGDINLGQGAANGGVLSVKEIYGRADQDVFKLAQINPILTIPGYGIKIFGDYTLQSSATMLSYIPVRRTLNHIQSVLQDQLLFANFDPNDQILRNSIIKRVNRVLEPIKYGRGIESYQVISDTSNNPPDRVRAGELRVSAAFVPIGSARIIILDTVLTNSGADFTESIQAVV